MSSQTYRLAVWYVVIPVLALIALPIAFHNLIPGEVGRQVEPVWLLAVPLLAIVAALDINRERHRFERGVRVTATVFSILFVLAWFGLFGMADGGSSTKAKSMEVVQVSAPARTAISSGRSA